MSNKDFEKKTTAAGETNLLKGGGKMQGNGKGVANKPQPGKNDAQNGGSDNATKQAPVDNKPAAAASGNAQAAAVIKPEAPKTLQRDTPTLEKTDAFLSEIRSDFTEGSASYVKAIDLKVAALEEEIAALKKEKADVLGLIEAMKVCQTPKNRMEQSHEQQ